MSEIVNMPPSGDEKSPADMIGEELRKQLEIQFRRGLFQGVIAVTGVVNQEISKLAQKPKKRLADYQATLAEISRLCTTKLNNPDTPKED